MTKIEDTEYGLKVRILRIWSIMDYLGARSGVDCWLSEKYDKNKLRVFVLEDTKVQCCFFPWVQFLRTQLYLYFWVLNFRKKTIVLFYSKKLLQNIIIITA